MEARRDERCHLVARARTAVRALLMVSKIPHLGGRRSTKSHIIGSTGVVEFRSRLRGLHKLTAALFQCLSSCLNEIRAAVHKAKIHRNLARDDS